MSTTLFTLHFLGGSGRTMAWTADRLPGHIHVVGIDLPGFGDAAALMADDVAALADYVIARIRQTSPARWALAGHSMGAKIAMAVTRRAEDGEAGLGGLHSLILIAGSPPAPEPMAESRRQTMLGWFAGDPAQSRHQAESFIRANAATRLPPAMERLAVDDVLRLRRGAWSAWLSGGSRENWAARIGVLRTSCLVVAGGKDADLGEAAQRSLTLPHLSDGRLVVMPGGGHLLPLEQPGVLARLITAHLAATPSAPAIDPAYLALIESDHVSEHLRAALRDRARPDDPAATPCLLTATDLADMRAVLARVVPQVPPKIDLAARIDRALAAGKGDGWRYAALPPDAQACRDGLATLAAAAGTGGFAALATAEQDRLLSDVAAGRCAPPGAPLDAAAIALWFEDLRAQAVKLYVAHPATLARMAYSGIANGGDAATMQGFQQIGIGARDPWEPPAA